MSIVHDDKNQVDIYVKLILRQGSHITDQNENHTLKLKQYNFISQIYSTFHCNSKIQFIQKLLKRFIYIPFTTQLTHPSKHLENLVQPSFFSILLGEHYLHACPFPKYVKILCHKMNTSEVLHPFHHIFYELIECAVKCYS